ncbi:hypothetical protein CV102_25480 [Natronococcus pandeyae]|uniref:Uncharacterized protein n=1 Tax=Natronococcus pandeyae TaxID=2055836 RepID=A0A8J8PVX1_9EURY|nr:hypothetical protein [Natronococcus pandeyae]TYL35861.1 hypothetical protein CV102_25480 [Natronococcus pandeyae]
MGIRTAIEHNALVTFLLLFAIGWVVLIGLQITAQMGSPTSINWVGRHGLGGVMGILVMLIFLGLVIAAFGALGEPDPAPEEWPPE